METLLLERVVPHQISDQVYQQRRWLSAATGEWVFGRTQEEKNGTCQFVGIVLVYTGFLTLLTLGVIDISGSVPYHC